MTKEQSTNPLLEALKILAKKLNHSEYKAVSGTMFRLYMGDKLGYRDTFDAQIIADIQAVWQFNREKKVKKKAEVLKLKVFDGGKNRK